MPRFDVVVYRQVNQFVQLVVDAATEEEARAIAAEATRAGPADRWQLENELNDGAYTFAVSLM